MVRNMILAFLLFGLCSISQGADSTKAKLIGIQGACENFICKLSDQPSPDVRDLKQQVTRVLADRGFVNSIVDINFYAGIHTASMNIDHDLFSISVSAKDGRLTQTNLYAK